MAPLPPRVAILGYFKRGTLAKQIEDKTFDMKAGDVSDVIRTKQGFVILKVTEHHNAGVPPFSEIEPRIQDAIYMEKLQPALREYLTKLREDAYHRRQARLRGLRRQPQPDQARRNRGQRRQRQRTQKEEKIGPAFRLSLA